MDANGIQLSTPDDATIVLTRRFRAPHRLVWEAMFVPDKMRRWMLPPPGWTLTACECDARVGGGLRLTFTNADGNSATTLRGEFTEAVPHERIVHTERMEQEGRPIGSLLETHAFAEEAGVTTMTITQAYESKGARDDALASGMDRAMEAGYRQLDAMLANSA